MPQEQVEAGIRVKQVLGGSIRVMQNDFHAQVPKTTGSIYSIIINQS